MLTSAALGGGRRVLRWESRNAGSPAAETSLDSFYLSFYLCSLTLLGFIAVSDEFLHWYVIPVLACGVVIGRDAVDWLRGRFQLLDPIGCLGALGLHMLFLAPLLHVWWDQWMPYITPPHDWRPWLGGMAILNFLGLLLYVRSRGPRDIERPPASRNPIWQVVPNRFIPMIGVALIVTGMLQLWIYQMFGGIEGYITTYMEARQSGFVDTAFKGMGILFIVSESFPMLAMMGFALYARQRSSARSWGVLLVAFLVYFVLLMLFGGLRGSRGNTLYSLIIGAGMIHLFVRRFSRPIIAAGAIFGIAFMYVYGFYKEMGAEAVTVFEAESDEVQAMETKTKRTFEVLLLGDFGRADVQAFILYRLVTFPAYYDYGWGRSYAGAAALLIPNAVWPDRPETKVKEGTEVMFGRGGHRVGLWDASNIYGLAGEAMLNFGPFAAPLSFVVLGWVVKKFRRFTAGLDAHDPRVLLVPFGLIFIIHVFTADSDNVLWFTAKFVLVPLVVTVLGSRMVYRRAGGAQ